MLKHFLAKHGTDYDEIISYSDDSWTTGGLYEIAGFVKDGIIDPDYFWCKGEASREPKERFRHAYLEKKLTTYDPTKTEKENCEANGYFQVHDCGKTRWKLTLSLPK